MMRDILLAHGDHPAALAGLRLDQIRSLEAIAACGTEAMGTHAEACDLCGDARRVPNTCGNRCCPHCQGRRRLAWVAARQAELLPVNYFHVVMTLPSDLRPLSHVVPDVVLGALMHTASDTIDEVCRNDRFLGGEVGQLAVLHTWRRDLHWHPHVHLIVTAGAWDAARQRWIPAKRFGPEQTPFLAPVAVVRSVFKRRLITALRRAYQRGELDAGRTLCPDLTDAATFEALLARCSEPDWVIRIEPPFGGPQQLLKYLGAYVSRVAISPKRILAHDPIAGTVTYTWTTNAEPDRPQQATLPVAAFIRLFAQHILPPRFQRIRFRGLWSTATRATKLHLVQRHLGGCPQPPPPSPSPTPATPANQQPEAPDDPYRCPCCGIGTYQRQPGPCPRPSPHQRRTILMRLRQGLRATPHGATTTA